jgi:gluconolactonase
MLMARAMTVLILLLAVVGFREVTSATRTFINDHNEYAIGHIDRKDPRFDALIPKDAKIEIVASGFKWTEGPVWDKRSNELLFTDIPNNRVVRWSAKDGVSDFLKPSGYTGASH